MQAYNSVRAINILPKRRYLKLCGRMRGNWMGQYPHHPLIRPHEFILIYQLVWHVAHAKVTANI